MMTAEQFHRNGYGHTLVYPIEAYPFAEAYHRAMLAPTAQKQAIAVLTTANELLDTRERLRQREAELEQRWIAVGERMPNKGQMVLTVWPKGDVDINWMLSVSWYKATLSGDQPTHWQPLPSPPKEAKS